MLRNYIKIAWRNIVKSKTFSFINVLGLALGMTCSLLILLWVQDERRMNRFHANGPRMYQVLENQQWTGSELSTTPATPGPMAAALKAEIPEVKKSVKLTWEEEHLLALGTTGFKEKGRYASPDLFSIFSFPFLHGNPKTAIAGPTSIVISEAVAKKLFGRTDVLGRMVRLDNTDDRQVTGVMRDIPKTSSLTFDFVLPLEPHEAKNKWLNEWGNNGIRTFALLNPLVNVNRVNAKIRNMVHRHDAKVTTITTFLFPYEDTYLYSKFTNGKPDGGRIEYVRLFTIVAIFILIIACINFMNLATARSAKRAKEVGIRKVVGAERAYLIGQFVGEAVLMAGMALGFAIILVQLLLSPFNKLTDKHIAIEYGNPYYWLTLLALALVTGIVSGSYPALFLSSLQPIRILKGSLRFTAGPVLFRQGLVVFQFSLSLLLIIGTLIAGRQVEYIRTKNLGLDRENVIYMALEGELPKRFDSFKQELEQAPGIQTVTASGSDPLAVGSSTTGLEWKGKDPKDKTLFMQLSVSYDFINTMKIRMLEGRDFDKAIVTDSTNYIINEEAARRMGMKNPVGQDLKFWEKNGKIVGMVKDFHLNSLRVAIEPLIIRLDTASNNTLLVRTRPGQTEKALASLQQLTKKYNPAYPFDYVFADDSFEKQYNSETLIGKLADYFAILAIFIACLGLFGLAMFTAEQRTKEIGVRKVLGASVVSIVTLLSKDFVRLVFISIVIATPIAWYTMSRWLQDFVYRIDIDWWVFALAGLLAITIALLTVSFQSIKAALMDPVKSLRTE
ncbi:ABC transporter permease [Spirosoma utsteinense]|uniref:Permease n=1 Tax=Spirosoma utsteinense TaxID=2585773 RepID=A0ABR6W6I1_9BACT|nr:ABC transporter permease [Spirosoma utsteinense]MBC3788569.1 putative permease [Spirosoma utsteinense]MBC3791824.1 putative permease [Spirosoma utsteinense]